MSRKGSMASTFISEKRISQWEDLMRKFSEAHKEECHTVSLDIPRAPRSVKYFPTGSQYEGTWDVLGMSGYGEYTFPNGVKYNGDFEDGMFHGKGELVYEDGAVICGKWQKGVMTEKTLLFNDSLEYSEQNWKYCIMPDRRFAVEYDNELKPSGQCYLTADQPTKEIPDGYFDTCDGFYCPKTKNVYTYDDLTHILRSPSAEEQKWIVDNCRRSPEEPYGPRPELYERWLEPILHPQPTPNPAAGVKSGFNALRQTSIFDQDFAFYDNMPTSFYDTAGEAATTMRSCDRHFINIKLNNSIKVERSIGGSGEPPINLSTTTNPTEQNPVHKLNLDRAVSKSLLSMYFGNKDASSTIQNCCARIIILILFYSYFY